MKWTNMVWLFFAATVMTLAQVAATTAATVDISLNVFPTNLGNPNGGGTWTLVAKTDAPLGIAGISAYLKDISTAGITIESDLNSILNGGNPFVGVFGGAVNLVYGQDISSGPITPGVGTISFSDGPDPLGDPAWNDATLIFSGAYSSMVPMFTNAGANTTDANVLASIIVGNAAVDADTSTVVRVAVPEPATIGLAVCAVIAAAAARKRCGPRSPRSLTGG
jgi:hypothetical protein